MKKISIISVFSALMLLSYSCADLEIENQNDPNFEKVVNTPEDLQGLVAGAFASIQRPFYNYQGHPNFEFTADHITMTNNVQHWWSVYKVEPRVRLNNSLTYAELDNLTVPWTSFNAAISNCNDVINAIEVRGFNLGDQTNMVLAAAYFARGLAAGYIANTFDKGYAAEIDSDLGTLQLVSYPEMVEYAVSSLDKCIALCESNSFTLANSFVPTTGGPYSSARLGRLANTYAGYFLMTNARTAAENAATDWARVLAYANKGMATGEDYVFTSDNNQWQNWLQYLSGLFWYWRVDHRVIRHFDPSYPKRFPLEAAATVPAATTNDARLAAYYAYETDMSYFNLSRGPQLRSHYRWNKYPEMWNNNGIGPIRHMLAYQNDLMKAEALIMANDDVNGARAILNAGPRVTVGGLAPVPASATAAQVLAVIFAERDIELTYTDYNLHHKDMRRRDMLQIGSFTMHPVPASELTTIGAEIYTFGGVDNAGQPGTASGANSWLNP